MVRRASLGVFVVFSILVVAVLFQGRLGILYGRAINSISDYMYQSHETAILRVRSIRHLNESEYFSTRQPIARETGVSIDQGAVALLIIDAWAVGDHPNKSYAKDISQKLSRRVGGILDIARKSGIKIYHSGNGREYAAFAKPLHNEIDLSWLHRTPSKFQTLYFFTHLKAHGIRTLLVAGNGLHLCIWDRPIGIDKLRIFPGLDIHVVRDAVVTNEYADVENEPMLNAFLSYLEADRFPTTRSDWVAQALAK